MKKSITTQLTETLTNTPSYFRWSNKRIAARIGCKEITVKRIKNKLSEVQTAYENKLKLN